MTDDFDVDDGLLDALARGTVIADDAVGMLLLSWAVSIQADAARAASSFSLAAIEARAVLTAAGGPAAAGAGAGAGAANIGGASRTGSAGAAGAGSGGATVPPGQTHGPRTAQSEDGPGTAATHP